MTKTKAQNEQTKALKSLESKWGKSTLEVDGWTAIPNILLERQQVLGIDAVKLNILLVLLKHWWEKSNMPFPSRAKIGDIVGRDKSTVQRHIREMEERGLLKRNERYQKAGGQTSNEYDLNGLIANLQALAKKELNERKKRTEDDSRKRRGYIT